MAVNRIYLECSYEDKDECKKAGGKWDASERKWYITGDQDIANFGRWITMDQDVGKDGGNSKYPRAFQKFNQLIERLEELRKKNSSLYTEDKAAEHLLWNSLDLAEENINRAFGVISPNMANHPDISYAIDYANLKPEYLNPEERAKLQSDLREEFYERLDDLDAEALSSDYFDGEEECVLADEGYSDGLSPLSNEDFARDDEDGWPYDDGGDLFYED